MLLLAASLYESVFQRYTIHSSVRAHDGCLYTEFLPLRIRITRLPTERFLEGFDLSRYEVGQTYDVGPRLAELMIVMDYAAPEMRRSDRGNAADGQERRRQQ